MLLRFPVSVQGAAALCRSAARERAGGFQKAVHSGFKPRFSGGILAVVSLEREQFQGRPQLGLSLVGDVASAVENALAAYSGTTAAPHEYFDQTGAV